MFFNRVRKLKVDDFELDKTFVNFILEKNAPISENKPIIQDTNRVIEEGPPIQNVFKEINESKPIKARLNFKELICTADLEAIITPEGNNYVYMAAWYNNLTNKIYHVSPNALNQEIFLNNFWKELIEANKGRVCYFHNWVVMTLFFLYLTYWNAYQG